MTRIGVASAVAVGLLVAVSLVAKVLHGSGRRDQLRQIVQQQCVPHWLATRQPAPCSSVTLLGGGTNASGYAVLHDRKGGIHYLLIPTRTVSGIESPMARSADTPNYFDAAWKERGVLATESGMTLPRATIGLAVNRLGARSQDQLHIHMSCLRPPMFEALKQSASKIGATWQRIELAGHSYQAMRMMGETLAPSNPINLLADDLAGARGRLADYTVLVAGADFAQGPGFMVLASTEAPSAELLLDATCAVAR